MIRTQAAQANGNGPVNIPDPARSRSSADRPAPSWAPRRRSPFRGDAGLPLHASPRDLAGAVAVPGHGLSDTSFHTVSITSTITVTQNGFAFDSTTDRGQVVAIDSKRREADRVIGKVVIPMPASGASPTVNLNVPSVSLRGNEKVWFTAYVYGKHDVSWNYTVRETGT